MFAQVPELAISLSATALLKGKIAPKSLYVSGARIAVIRNIDGSVGIELPRGQRSSEGILGRLFEEFIRASGEETALIELNRIEIDNAALSVDDRQMGINWTAPKSSITLNRADAGIAGRAKFDLLLGEQVAKITLNGLYHAEREEMSLTFGFAEISPPRIAELSRAFKGLGHFDAPVTGNVAVRVSREGVLDSVDFELELDAGKVLIPEPYKMEVAIQSARFKGSFDQAQALLDIENASVDMGGQGAVILPQPLNHRLPIRGISTSAKYWPELETLQVEKFVADLAGPSFLFHLITTSIIAIHR